MFDPVQFKLYGSPKPGINSFKGGFVSPTGKSLNEKFDEDEEFYRIMESIKTGKNELTEYQSQSEPEQENGPEPQDVSYIMLFMLLIVLLMGKIIHAFQSIIIKAKDLFDQLFPYIWSWMKRITRGTYVVTDRKVPLLILCVPLLTLVLFVYCSLLILNAITEFLLSSAPIYLTQMVVMDKFKKILLSPKL